MLFDYVIITHLPSFYKINLFNELSKKKNIFIVFVGKNSSSRNSDFVEKDFNFNYYYLSDTNFENRNIFFSLFKLIKLLVKLKFNKIIVNGWDLPEFWLPIIFLNIKKGVIVESTIYESSLVGYKYYSKYIFLRFFDFALPSGLPHKELLLKLQYKGRIYLTGGVGLINFNINEQFFEKKNSNRAIYIGRLSKEKNLDFLISVINDMPEISLTIIGEGPEADYLKSIKHKNIEFKGYVSNTELTQYFNNHDFLILPSKSETWGLVVEEALYNRLPVIVSNSVGSSKDLVEFYSCGYIFESNSVDSLKLALKEILIPHNIDRIKKNLLTINWEERASRQLNVYL
jgi:glycosyltransferase involved in cell wall biosynthesis